MFGYAPPSARTFPRQRDRGRKAGGDHQVAHSTLGQRPCVWPRPPMIYMPAAASTETRALIYIHILCDNL